MKYTNEVTINLPKQKVIELFNNPDNLKHWQPGLQLFEPISGEPGKEGSQNRLKFKMGKREIEMIETVVSNKLPDEMTTTYDAKGVHNVIVSKFEKVDDQTTRYITDNEFKFTSPMMKIFGFLMPGAFKKQSQQYLEQFKTFAEREGK